MNKIFLIVVFLILTQRGFSQHNCVEIVLWDKKKILNEIKNNTFNRFCSGESQIAIANDSIVLIFDWKGNLKWKHILPLQGIRRLAFDSEDNLLIVNKGETKIYKINAEKITTYAMNRPEDWYICLDSSVFYPFFRDVSWIPSIKLNDWKQKDLATRFDYFYNLYLSPAGEIYMVFPSVMIKFYKEGYYSLSRSDILPIDHLLLKSQVLIADENVVVFYNRPGILYCYNRKSGKLDTFNFFEEGTKVLFASNREGQLFVLKINTENITLSQLKFSGS